MGSRYSKDPKVHTSLRHSVQDGVAYSVMAGGGESYFSAFAMYFKATTAEVGVLATLPPLIGSFFQLLSAALARRVRNRRSIIMLGASLQVLSWLPLTLLPALFPDYALVIILGSLILFYGAGNLVTPQWASLMGDLVPERQRGRYFAHRSRLSSITGLVALVLGGLILQLFSESTIAIAGFVIIFSIAALARIVSAWHMSRMHEPPAGKPLEVAARGWLRHWRHSPTLHFSQFIALMQLAVAIASPFFAVYMLRHLEFSYLQFTTATAVSVMAQFLTLRTWGRIGDVFGHRMVLRVTGMLVPLTPALWMLTTDFHYLLLVQAFSGTVWGGFTLAGGNLLYDLVPREERIAYFASHNVTVGVTTFLGALLGGWLAAVLPDKLVIGHWLIDPGSVLCWLFLISGFARLVVAVVFLPGLRETRPVRPFAWPTLLLRVTGSRPLFRLLRPLPARPARVTVPGMES